MEWLTVEERQLARFIIVVLNHRYYHMHALENKILIFT